MTYKKNQQRQTITTNVIAPKSAWLISGASQHREDNWLHRMIIQQQSVAERMAYMHREAPQALAMDLMNRNQNGYHPLQLAVLEGNHRASEEILTYLEANLALYRQWLVSDTRNGQDVAVEWMVTIKSHLLQRVLKFMPSCAWEEYNVLLQLNHDGMSLIHSAMVNQFLIDETLEAFIQMQAYHLLAMFDGTGYCPMIWLVAHYQSQYEPVLMRFFCNSESRYWSISDIDGNTLLQQLALKSPYHPEFETVLTTALKRLSQDAAANAFAYSNMKQRHMVDYENYDGITLGEILKKTLPHCVPLLEQVQGNYQRYQQQSESLNQKTDEALPDTDDASDANDCEKLHRFFLNNSKSLPDDTLNTRKHITVRARSKGEMLQDNSMYRSADKVSPKRSKDRRVAPRGRS